MKFRVQNNIWTIILVSLVCFPAVFFVGCSNREVFYQFHTFDKEEWHKDSVACFEVDVKDSIPAYNVFIELRNNDNYPYKNIWLFVSTQYPSGEARQDTVECILADDYGKWYGKGFTLYELTIPFENKVVFPQSGKYIYTIRQGMRDDLLEGISNVGLKVQPVTP